MRRLVGAITLASLAGAPLHAQADAILLVEAVEAWAAARGLVQLAVRGNVVRVESHPFYERLGFVRVRTRHAYRKQLP